MATVNVDGYDCIGILSIPVFDLELPVLADWSYSKLKKLRVIIMDHIMKRIL